MKLKLTCGSSSRSVTRVIAILDLVLSALAFLIFLFLFISLQIFHAKVLSQKSVTSEIDPGHKISPPIEYFIVTFLVIFVVLKISVIDFFLSIFLLKGANSLIVRNCRIWWWSNVIFLISPLAFLILFILGAAFLTHFFAGPIFVTLLVLLYKIYSLLIVKSFIHEVNNDYFKMDGITIAFKRDSSTLNMSNSNNDITTTAA